MALLGLSCEPIIFLYNVIVVINYSIVPQLLLRKICLRAEGGPNITSCSDLEKIPEYVHQEASKWWLYILLCFQIPSIFTILMWGPLTDFIGRRKALLFFPLVDAVCSLGLLMNSYYIERHPAYIMIGYFTVSLFGELQGVLTFCYAHTADITKDKFDSRTSRMALVEATLFLSGVPAGLISGYLLQAIGFVSVFGVTLCIDGLIFSYVFFLLPDISGTQDNNDGATLNLTYQNDSTDSEKETERTVGYDTPKKNFSIHEYIGRVRELGRDMKAKKVILPLIISFALLYYAVLGEQMVQTLFLKAKPFLFPAEKVGYYVAAQSTSRAVGTVVITQLSLHLLNLNDYYLIIIGAVSQIISYVSIGFSYSTLTVFLACCVGFGIPIAMTTIRSVITKNVSSNKYGTLLCLLGSINIMSGMISNVISWLEFDKQSSSFSGIVYFGLAGVSSMSLVFIIICYIIFERRRNSYNSL